MRPIPLLTLERRIGDLMFLRRRSIATGQYVARDVYAMVRNGKECTTPDFFRGCNLRNSKHLRIASVCFAMRRSGVRSPLLHKLTSRLQTLSSIFTLFTQVQDPNITCDPSPRIKQLPTVARYLRIFQKQSRLWKVRDLFRVGLTPVLRWTRHAVNVFVVQLKVEPLARW